MSAVGSGGGANQFRAGVFIGWSPAAFHGALFRQSSCRADCFFQCVLDFGSLIAEQHIPDSAMPSEGGELHAIAERVPRRHCSHLRDFLRGYFKSAFPEQSGAGPAQRVPMDHDLLNSECPPTSHSQPDEVPEQDECEKGQHVQPIR